MATGHRRRRLRHEAAAAPPMATPVLGEPGTTTLRQLPYSRSREEHGSSSATTGLPFDDTTYSGTAPATSSSEPRDSRVARTHYESSPPTRSAPGSRRTLRGTVTGRRDPRWSVVGDDVQMVAEGRESQAPPIAAAAVRRRTAQRQRRTWPRHRAVGPAIEPRLPGGRRQSPAPSQVRRRRRPSEPRRRPTRRRERGGRNLRPSRRQAHTAAEACTAPPHPPGRGRMHGRTARESCRRPPLRGGAPGRTTAAPLRGCVRHGRLDYDRSPVGHHHRESDKARFAPVNPHLGAFGTQGNHQRVGEPCHLGGVRREQSPHPGSVDPPDRGRASRHLRPGQPARPPATPRRSGRSAHAAGPGSRRDNTKPRLTPVVHGAAATAWATTAATPHD
jgi:hypothetical protein